MNIRIIDGILTGTLEILYRKIMDPKIRDLIEKSGVTTVGLCSGKFVDMIVASDIAEKAANVIVSEISGLCPQHTICIGIFGDTGSVKSALKSIENNFKSEKINK
ncbi:BMC domain-containing protein [Clostridium sp.]|uniref:BMC domain-containing protein n=1 Tax=Clostridium sp. TaxID=1506 RepID=UPI002FDCC718